MIEKLNAAEWQFHSPAGSGETRSLLSALKGVTGVNLEIRSEKPVSLNAITADGTVLPLAVGQFCRFNGRLEGFVAIEVICDAPIAFKALEKVAWWEVPDPTKITVDSDEKALSPTQHMIRDELRKYVSRLEADKLLADDVSVEELLDDIEAGDHEFEAEPDPFGLGYEEPDLFPDEEEPAQESAPKPEPEKPAEKQEPTPPAQSST